MNQLEAVQELMMAVLQAPPSALDTGGTGDVAHAETLLDINRRRTLAKGWTTNTEYDVDLNFASVSLTGTASAAFAIGDRVTQASTGAVGICATAAASGAATLQICPIDGSADFDAANDVTSNASTPATLTTASGDIAVASGPIAVDLEVLELRRPPWEPRLEQRGNLLRDPLDTTMTHTGSDFTGAVTVDMIRLLAMADLPESLAALIVYSAAIPLARKVGLPREDLRDLQAMMSRHYQEATRVDTINSGVNILDTLEARAIRGLMYTPVARRNYGEVV